MRRRWRRLTRKQKILLLVFWPLWIPAYLLAMFLWGMVEAMDAVMLLFGDRQ